MWNTFWHLNHCSRKLEANGTLQCFCLIVPLFAIPIKLKKQGIFKGMDYYIWKTLGYNSSRHSSSNHIQNKIKFQWLHFNSCCLWHSSGNKTLNCDCQATVDLWHTLYVEHTFPHNLVFMLKKKKISACHVSTSGNWNHRTAKMLQTTGYSSCFNWRGSASKVSA